ncbi:hypothetical protein WR25_14801 [Diploscapter pachys]|uniref:ZP domain-containing protein n=1 Tax=Diploscapter pachys TaxID=2018661 RepID=A0A2A2JGS4_9BILA|nr:hypothetical protein WR25_14801 [Diploscapter pachys]
MLPLPSILQVLSICIFLSSSTALPQSYNRIPTHSQRSFQPDEIVELPVGRFPDPDCSYTVHKKDQNGPRITGEHQVHIGDALYHHWKCNYGQMMDHTIYCLMVHNCTVSSAQAQKVLIIDEFGCSLFPSILPHIEYGSDDLSGGLPLHAFSLDVDTAAVLFECNVKLLLKLNGVCRRPICPNIEDLRRSDDT